MLQETLIEDGVLVQEKIYNSGLNPKFECQK